MTLVFFILIVIASCILGLLILVQNPKGGGLAGSIGGFNNQFMGVKQTNDVLEKGTWLFATIIGVLCIVSTAFFKGGSSSNGTQSIPEIKATPTAPANPAGNGATVPGGTAKPKQ